MIYTVTFNPALDYVMSVPSFNLNEVNRSQKEQLLFGGKGINVSVVLHRLGIPSTALGFAAGFTGDVLLDGVRTAGVKTDFIRLPQGLTRINVKIQSEHETDFNGKGPEIPPESVDALFDKLDALGADDTLVLAGSIPPSLPDNIYEQILSRLSGKGVQCIVDATKDLLLNVLKYRPFLIKPNHHELGELFGTAFTSAEEMVPYARKLRHLGAQNILVSMAGDGALLLDCNDCIHAIAAPQGKVISSVGAGDSMVAGFLAGWLEKKDFAYALRLGTAAGSATAFSEGLATRSKIFELFASLQPAQ